MRRHDPIVIGGNGHSGTRVFCEVITQGGVFTGIPRLTKRPDSEDLRIIDLLTRWVRPYVCGSLTEGDSIRMRNAFVRRLRIYFPVRCEPWGFKNPRNMLLLPFLNDLFPQMKFIHVIRDGRDVSLGNEFARGNPYVDAFLQPDEATLSDEEKMACFWGRSNARAADYAAEHMAGRYLRMRWEDLCIDPRPHIEKLFAFVNSKKEVTESVVAKVRKPSSLGRWRTFEESEQARVTRWARPWLTRFGYL